MTRWAMVAVVAGGCGGGGLVGVPAGPSGTSGTSDGSASTTGTTSADHTGTEEDGSGNGGVGFIIMDLGNPVCVLGVGPRGAIGFCGCNPWIQDCPFGQKCSAWADDGGNAWNATRCVDLEEDPGQLGEACLAQGSGVSGFDSCDLGLMCWNVNPQTLEGTCVAHCGGSEQAPFCDVDTSCVIANGGVIVLCLPDCDPVVQDCPDGQRCVVAYDTPTCIPTTASFDFESPCQNACAVGEYCADASDVPGCSEPGCCTRLCDLTVVSPDTACPGALLGQRCLPLFENPTASLAHVGGCGIP